MSIVCEIWNGENLIGFYSVTRGDGASDLKAAVDAEYLRCFNEREITVSTPLAGNVRIDMHTIEWTHIRVDRDGSWMQVDRTKKIYSEGAVKIYGSVDAIPPAVAAGWDFSEVHIVEAEPKK